MIKKGKEEEKDDKDLMPEHWKDIDEMTTADLVTIKDKMNEIIRVLNEVVRNTIGI